MGMLIGRGRDATRCAIRNGGGLLIGNEEDAYRDADGRAYGKGQG